MWYSHISLDKPGPGVVENLVLEGADPATFVVVEGDTGKDATREYRRAAVVSASK